MPNMYWINRLIINGSPRYIILYIENYRYAYDKHLLFLEHFVSKYRKKRMCSNNFATSA